MTRPLTDAAPAIVVGPLLRYVDHSRATVWVETSSACEVEVLGHRAATWSVHGHHFAVVAIEGLAPGTTTEYEVALDGRRAWPDVGSRQPPSVIRTLHPDRELRLAFGSCRRSASADAAGLKEVGADALAAMAYRMMRRSPSSRPDALLFIGDQIYADDPSDQMKARLRAAHGTERTDVDHGAAGDDRADVSEEAGSFEEYSWLYEESWSDPAVRWLLSTVPSAMILDDHDLRDDWNSSLSWREWSTQQHWWHDRVVGAFGSYWVYQHLGNLSPEALAEDAMYRTIREAPDDAERSRLLNEFAWRTDTEGAAARWSYVRDFGRTRLVVVDSRCARVLDPDHRAMVDEAEWAWVVEQSTADVDHLLIGTSLPVLMLHGIHYLEGWNEATAEGAWGRIYAKLGERVRLALDLEHWAAFHRSFVAMTELVREVATAPSPPASVLWLSGDVHCSYLAEAVVPGVDPHRTAVHQLTMSPFRNPLQKRIQAMNSLVDRRPVAAVVRFLARRAGVPDPSVSWRVRHGPWFPNGVMTVVVDRREVSVEVEHARVGDHDEQLLDRTLTLDLSPR